MKKYLLIVTLLFSTVFAEQKVMSSVLNNVLIKNVDDSMQVALKMKKNLESNNNSEILKKDFKNLVSSWKKVETFYIAASLNEDVIDTPRYIDIFHNLKENLQEQMKRVVDSKDSLDVEMYKNSFKTINALEYVLFESELNDRKINISKIIVNNILNRLDEIRDIYIDDSKKFLEDTKWAHDETINMLIESSFKVRDWRVGDVSGHSKKYKDNADNRRAEYALSKTSKDAIEAIIDTHKQIMDSSNDDFGTLLIKKGFQREVDLIRNEINNSLENLKYLKNGNFESKDVKKLYESLDRLHKAYYISLVNATGITAKILDADGD